MSDEPTSDAPEPRRQRIRVTANDDVKHGVYSNFVAVQHGPHEFTLDFGQAMPGGEEGEVVIDVVSRVKIAPTLVGQLMRSLANAQSKYEDKFGTIKALG